MWVKQQGFSYRLSCDPLPSLRIRDIAGVAQNGLPNSEEVARRHSSQAAAPHEMYSIINWTERHWRLVKVVPDLPGKSAPRDARIVAKRRWPDQLRHVFLNSKEKTGHE